MKQLPPEPTFAQILAAPTSSLNALSQVQEAYDLRRIVLEGVSYFKLCEAGSVQPNTTELTRFKLALKEFDACLKRNDWKDDTLLAELE